MLSYTRWPALGSHQTWGGGRDNIFVDFTYLTVFNALLIARTTINKYRLIHNLHFLLEPNLQK
jgi:hypothetical protein